MSKSKIQWTDTTDNPIHLINDGRHGGHWCRKVSPGCANCYAEGINQSHYFQFASHLSYTGPAPDNLHFDLSIVKKWANARSSSKRFVCSMTDLFGDWVPLEWQISILDAAAAAPSQIIQLLTKRPEQAQRAMVRWCELRGKSYIPDNIWMGVSVEDSQTAIDRHLHCHNWVAWCKTVWISYEPALGFVDFKPYFDDGFRWIVLGGESGPGSRDCDINWLIEVASEARRSSVACFVKQLGSKPVAINSTGQLTKFYTSDRKGGKLIDFPTELQIREFPNSSVILF